MTTTDQPSAHLPGGAEPAPSLDTIVDRFRSRVASQPTRTALRHRRGDEWCEITWGDYGVAVAEVAAGLVDLGVDPGDRVALLSANRPDWHIVDLGILSAAAITVPVYPTSSSTQIAYVLADSGARVCFVDTSEQLAKVLAHLDELPHLERLVVFDDIAGLDQAARVISLSALRRLHLGATSPTFDVVDERVSAIGGDDVATLVYTSGTTGPPKGTCITHGNISWTIDSVQSLISLSPSDRFLSYLPLSHIAERVTSHFGQIVAGGETWFALSLATVPDDLQACRPTIFFAVPRVWQKFHSKILEDLGDKHLGLDTIVERVAATRPDRHDDRSMLAGLADRAAAVMVDRALAPVVRRRLGLDQARLLVSSAAPIHPDLLRWFDRIGLSISEVWGQTEDCGPATMNPPDAIRIGSIGKPIPGLEVRTADDGELLVRGGSVCAGYFGRPDDTADLIDGDGWMYTGDLGRVDDDGYVWITGRKKDLIINAAGKNISPAEIESRLSMESLIGQAVVVGDGRRYLNALIAIDPDAASDWAKNRGASTNVTELMNDRRFREAIAASVERVNQHHAPVEQIKYWRLLPEPLTIEGGELTPTLKVKRNVVQERFDGLIEEMYTDEE